MQQIILVGRVVKDAELRYTSSGKTVSNFNFAVDDGYGDNKKTIWFKCSMWEKKAEALNDHVTKGTPLTVIGRLSHTEGNPRTWTGNDGVTHASFEVFVIDLEFQGKGGQKQLSDEVEIPF